MKRNRKEAKREQRQVQTWNLPQARAALPYLSSVVRSLREHQLEALAHTRAANRLANRPGRPDRNTLIAEQEARKAAEQADAHVQEALAELEAMDVYCLDPVAGQALIPFVKNEQLAWYVYDTFDSEPFRFWRWHTDPIEMRRPVEEVVPDPLKQTWLA
jgi:hypothetical protein